MLNKQWHLFRVSPPINYFSDSHSSHYIQFVIHHFTWNSRCLVHYLFKFCSLPSVNYLKTKFIRFIRHSDQDFDTWTICTGLHFPFPIQLCWMLAPLSWSAYWLCMFWSSDYLFVCTWVFTPSWSQLDLWHFPQIPQTDLQYFNINILYLRSLRDIWNLCIFSNWILLY